MKQFKCFNRPYVSFNGESTISRFIIPSILFIIWGSVIDADASWLYHDPALPPIAICKNISVQLGPAGSISISGSDVDGGSYDPDGTIASLTVSPNTFSCSQVGPNTVIMTVTDNEGLNSTCSATVTVEDKIPPVMTCRDYTLYLNAAGTGTLAAADINNGSADNCSSPLFLYLSRTNFNCTDIGAPVPVTLIGTDASGNSASCTSMVTVMDNVAPVINVKSANLVLGSSGTATLLPADVDNGTFENCGSVTLSVNPETFSCADLGQKTVTLTATDSHGNSSSKNVTVNISSTLQITGMSLSSCDLSPTLALFEANVEGGDGDYSYFWRGLNPGSRPFMVIIPFPPSLQFFSTSILESPFFNNTMPNGYYNIRLTITDGNGCVDSTEIKINKTNAVFNNQTFLSSEACEGEIETYSVNYKGDATYSWTVVNGTILNSNPDTSKISVRWDLGAVQGIITTTILEPNEVFPGDQCETTVIDTITIITFPVPVFNSFVANVCSNFAITYSLTNTYPFQNWTVTGGIITAGGNISDNFVTVLWGNGPTGTVSVSVGNISTCLGSAVINVAINTLKGTITSLQDISCNGGNDGSVTVTADPGSGQAPYQYSLDGGAWQAGGTFSAISLGNHTATIRDAFLCTFDLPFVINQPAPVSGTLSAQNNVNCFGGADGSITISATGGVPPYEFRLNAGAFQLSNVFSGLSPGSYIVTIRDSHGCSGDFPATITQPSTPLNGSASVTDVGCYGESTGRIDLTVTGGTAPYLFLWSNGSVTEDIVNVTAGNYNVIITDSHGCTTTVIATVSQPATALNGIVSVVNVLCFGESTGAVNLTVTGGISPFSFVWNNGATTEDILNLPAGSYSVTITDIGGCTATVTANVTQPSSPVGGSVSGQTNVSCFGGTNGSVTIAGSGGVAPYEYQLGAGSFQTSGTFGTIGAGTYNITIRDANLCTFILQVTITEPSAALTGSITVTDNKCFGGNSGSCDLTVSGGNPPYTYLWSNGSVTEDISGLTAGNYSVTVTDSHGCTSVVNASIAQPATELTGSIISQTNVSVYGGNDGSVTISGAGGTSPYQYNLNGGSFQTSGTFGSLTAGSYTITVQDAGLCTADIPVTITQPLIPLTAVIISQTNEPCFGGSAGSITVEGWGGTSPYMYSYNGGIFGNSGTFGSLSAGIDTITVRDAVMDVFDIIITITEPDKLDVSVSGEDLHCYGAATGTVTAIALGGTAPYSFLWDTTPAQTTGTATGLVAGTYTVTVTDTNGCIGTNNATILQPAVDMTISITGINVPCNGGTSGSATAQVDGGLAPYTFSWNTSPEQTKDSATDLSAGNYTVTVTDSYGCIKTGSVNITEPQAILIEAFTDVASCPDSDDGAITLTVTGGISPYSAIWSDGITAQNRTKLKPGTYSVVMTDQNACAKSLVVEVVYTWSFNCLVIPQVITPNNDGFNDEWIIKNIDLYPNAEVHVYNRWGKMVFSTKNLSANPWDGRLDGKLVPTDSYHYILYLNDGSEPRSGVISVIR